LWVQTNFYFGIPLMNWDAHKSLPSDLIHDKLIDGILPIP
jgi:hypothetical protein